MAKESDDSFDQTVLDILGDNTCIFNPFVSYNRDNDSIEFVIKNDSYVDKHITQNLTVYENERESLSPLGVG